MSEIIYWWLVLAYACGTFTAMLGAWRGARLTGSPVWACVIALIGVFPFALVLWPFVMLFEQRKRKPKAQAMWVGQDGRVEWLQ